MNGSGGRYDDQRGEGQRWLAVGRQGDDGRAGNWQPSQPQPAPARHDPYGSAPQYSEYGEPSEYGEYGEPSEYREYGEPGGYGEHSDYYAEEPSAHYPEDTLGGRQDDNDWFVPGLGDEDPNRDYNPDRDPEYSALRSRRADRRADRQDRRDNRRPGRRPRWLAPLVALLVILIPVSAGGVYAFNLYQSKYHPADYSGDTPTGIAPRLQSLGVVASSRAFVLAAEHSTNQSGLKPGFYKLHAHMNAALAYTMLLSPGSIDQTKITIPEGWRVSTLITALGAHSGIPLSDYQAVLKNPAQLGLPSYAKNNPEGYLFPYTFDVVPNSTAKSVLAGMVAQFNQMATSINLPAAATRVNLSPAEVVIVASMLQAEGGRLSDYPKIARVVYNRLNANMPLQFDSTVLFGLGKFGTTVTQNQINTATPYNTYLNKGLPPGPIDSPGLAAIQAALHPAKGNWLFFFTHPNGITQFSATPIS
jgi:UPF0755 protein